MSSRPAPLAPRPAEKLSDEQLRAATQKRAAPELPMPSHSPQQGTPAQPNTGQPNTGQGGGSEAPQVPGFDVIGMLTGLSGQILSLGYKDISDWVKSWAQATTTYSNISDIVAHPGERLVFVFHYADDEASIVFNGECVASKNIREAPSTHVSSFPVKPGLNMLIVAVNNRGYFDWGVWADVYEERSRRFLARFLFKGNDGFFGNMHMFSCRVWGR